MSHTDEVENLKSCSSLTDRLEPLDPNEADNDEGGKDSCLTQRLPILVSLSTNNSKNYQDTFNNLEQVKYYFDDRRVDYIYIKKGFI